MPEDNIQEEYFALPCYDFLNSYDQFINNNIYIPQFPGRGNLAFFKEYSLTERLNIPRMKEFSHSASTLNGSSGSPVFLENTSLVLGIHK